MMVSAYNDNVRRIAARRKPDVSEGDGEIEFLRTLI